MNSICLIVLKLLSSFNKIVNYEKKHGLSWPHHPFSINSSICLLILWWNCYQHFWNYSPGFRRSVSTNEPGKLLSDLCFNWIKYLSRKKCKVKSYVHLVCWYFTFYYNIFLKKWIIPALFLILKINVLNMKQSILSNWNFLRFLRLGIGIAIVVQGIMAKEVMFGIIGLLFSSMAVFNIGCCGTGTCSVPAKRAVQSAKDTSYEEVV